MGNNILNFGKANTEQKIKEALEIWKRTFEESAIKNKLYCALIVSYVVNFNILNLGEEKLFVKMIKQNYSNFSEKNLNKSLDLLARYGFITRCGKRENVIALISMP